MDFSRLSETSIDALWELQKAFKAEIGEGAPDEEDKERLKEAIAEGRIVFFGAEENGELIGCCSVTVGFSTFDYAPSGVFDDFYIVPAYRHKGVARRLAETAFNESGVSTLTVGCADCDRAMYVSLGFGVRIGSLLAFGS
ncbi:MAG: GNAT family N-acetyltransferase [Clostridia bacterium]|nr:GNAT family N-acetyltransferase [Clostridia bacterium]